MRAFGRSFLLMALAGIAAMLAGCSEQGEAGAGRKLDDFPGFSDARKLLDDAFSCSWATDRGTASCVRKRGADKLYVEREDELVTMFLGPPASGRPLDIKLDHGQPEARQVRDFYEQIERQSPGVASMQFNVGNASSEKVRDFIAGHFAFSQAEVDAVLQDFAEYEKAVASDHPAAALDYGKQRTAVTHGHLRLSGAGNGILLQRIP